MTIPEEQQRAQLPQRKNASRSLGQWVVLVLIRISVAWAAALLLGIISLKALKLQLTRR